MSISRFLFRAYHFLLHRLSANTLHGTHSPFVYRILEDVIYNDQPPVPAEILNLNKQLDHNLQPLSGSTHGAGSRSSNLSVQKLNRSASITPKKGALLFRLAHWRQPATVIELGTCLGGGTLYLHAANPLAKVYSIEGDAQRYNFTASRLRKFSSIQLFHGSFEDVLPELLKSIECIDLVYFDGNHAYEPTLKYFNMMLEKASKDSVFVFDDIYWSSGMKAAWDQIKMHPRVTVSIDLYHLGIIFFRTGQAKENFKIRF
jgi:predicted O-methyltransferase YrrM